VRGREGDRVGRKAATEGNPGREAGEAAAAEVGAAAEEAAAGGGGTGNGGRNWLNRAGMRGGKEKLWGPQVGGGNGGPPRMEGGRENLEGYAKWRLV
jgi:hypothetical protein